MKTIEDLSKAEKQELVAAARVANQLPGEAAFWQEVQERMDLRDAPEPVVTPREVK